MIQFTFRSVNRSIGYATCRETDNFKLIIFICFIYKNITAYKTTLEK